MLHINILCATIHGFPFYSFPLFSAMLQSIWDVGCEILVPRPGIKPTSPAMEVWYLNHWISREVPIEIFFYC